MEVVSTSNLVSSGTKKTTTACNSQHDYAIRGQYEYEAIRSFMIAEICKGTLRDTYTHTHKK